MLLSDAAKPATAFRGEPAPEIVDLGGPDVFAITKIPSLVQDPIRAQLIGANKAVTGGTTFVGTTPVLVMCRELLAQGVDPDRAMEVFRGATLALHIRSIGEAAALEIAADGIGFRPRRQPDPAPPVRENGRRGT